MWRAHLEKKCLPLTISRQFLKLPPYLHTRMRFRFDGEEALKLSGQGMMLALLLLCDQAQHSGAKRFIVSRRMASNKLAQRFARGHEFPYPCYEFARDE